MMRPVHTPQQVFDGILRAKTGAQFCTNFYPARQKLETWIAREALYFQHCGESLFFLRKERDFWHLHYCSPSTQALRRDLCDLETLHTERVVSDILGAPEALEALVPLMEGAGMHLHKRLARLARAAQGITASPADGVILAHRCDVMAVMGLLEDAFDRYAKQLPEPGEIELAAQASEILLLKCGETLAGLLFFETRGVTSTLRFWAVAQAFRSACVGSTLIRHYLSTHPEVRRFVLWADADNRDLIEKYRHYHYVEDGVVDYVLANELISR